MKNILRYFVVTIVLMMVGTLHVNAKVVFYPSLDKGIYNEQTGMYDITKNGITISVSATEYDVEDGESTYLLDGYIINPNTVMKIESSSSQIKMAVFKHIIEGNDYTISNTGFFFSSSKGKYNSQYDYSRERTFVSSSTGKYDCYGHCGYTSYAEYEFIDYI